MLDESGAELAPPEEAAAFAATLVEDVACKLSAPAAFTEAAPSMLALVVARTILTATLAPAEAPLALAVALEVTVFVAESSISAPPVVETFEAPPIWVRARLVTVATAAEASAATALTVVPPLAVAWACKVPAAVTPAELIAIIA